MSGRLEGRVALVTGGAAGIGRATVERFVAEGASVVAGDLDEAGLATLASDQVAVARCDVTSEDDQAALVALATERFGGLDIAIANAGTGWATKIVDHQLADWQRVIDVCLTGVFLTEGAFMLPGVVGQFLENAPIGRWAEPAEIASLMAFLVSDEASFITGTLQLVDGGGHLNRYPNIFAPTPGDTP